MSGDFYTAFACSLPYERCCGRKELEVLINSFYSPQDEELKEEIRKLRKLLERALRVKK